MRIALLGISSKLRRNEKTENLGRRIRSWRTEPTVKLLMSSRTSDGRLSPFRVFVAAFVLIVGLSGSWALASPLMSVPDEPSHAVKAAAVVRGQLGGVAPKVQTGFVAVTVPKWMVEASKLTCYAFKPQVTPSCQKHPVSHSTTLVTGGTSAGAYNPVYYEIVGTPSLVLSGQPAVYAMRLVSAALSSLFLAAMFAALVASGRRRWTVIAASMSITPMVLYLNGAINPNSLEFAATASFFVSLVALIERGRTPRPNGWMLALATASAAILANTRGLSLLWMAIALILAIVLCGWKNLLAFLSHWTAWIAVAVIGIASAFALWWLLTQRAPEGPLYDGARTPFWGAVGVMLDRTFDYGKGMIGLFGWGDAPAPDFVVLVFAAAYLLLTIAAVILAKGRSRAAVIVASVLFVLTPVVLQASVAYQTGFIWQGRYSLALFALLLLAAGLALDHHRVAWSPVLASFGNWLIVLLALGHAYAFLWTLRRYTIGIAQSRGWTDMFTIATWNPPLGWVTLQLVFIVLLGTASALLWSSTRRPATLPAADDHGRIPASRTGH